MCKDCGFYYTDKGIDKCHKLNKAVAPTECGECKAFVPRQYDGSEPFSPEEHEWLYRDVLNRKKMTNMQGLRL